MQIELTNGGFAVIDEADLPLVQAYKWHKVQPPNSTTFYAYTRPTTNGVRVRIAMHRLLLGLTDRRVKTDHRNFNGLDNRRENIRVATNSQSNAFRHHKNKYGFKGVHFNGNRWQAVIQGNRHLGMFASVIEAAQAYDKAALDLWGEFAMLNFPGNRLDNSSGESKGDVLMSDQPKPVCPRCGGKGVEPDWGKIGARHRTMRKAARLTMREVGRRMGFSESYISDLELGKRLFVSSLQERYLKALQAGNGEAMGAPAAGFKEASR